MAGITHAPLVHTSPTAQARPHLPQFLTSLASEASQPLAALPSQLPNPALHEPTAHWAPTHAGTPLATLQGRPQAPQLATSVDRFFSQPLPGLPSQSKNGWLQIPMP